MVVVVVVGGGGEVCVLRNFMTSNTADPTASGPSRVLEFFR